MPSTLSRRRLGGLVLACALAASAMPGRAADTVRVGSKIDTEGALLGNMILQVLEAAGIPTTNRLQLGATKIVRGALLSGDIDIYPEYTGNGAFFFSQDSDPVWKNAGAGWTRVKTLDAEKNGIVWLKPAPADNTWAIALRSDLAEANHLATLDDFSKWIGAGGTFKIAASAEFVESPAALPSFQKAYGFTLRQDQIVTLAGGDTATTIKAAAEGTSGVNGAMAYGTDGALAALGLVVLADPRGAQAVYAPTPTVRAATLAAHPTIETLLAPVFAALDGPTLRTLNAKIAVDGEDAGAVAKAWLKSRSFLR